jgi:hypothetical protein
MRHTGTAVFLIANCQAKATLLKKAQIGNVYHEAAKDNIWTRERDEVPMKWGKSRSKNGRNL